MKQLFLLLFLSSLVTACGLSGSRAVIQPDPVPFRLMPGELVLAASEDDIPPIKAELDDFVPAQKADLDEKDFVVGVYIGGESRAYPVRLLSLHEVVNDRIGNKAFAVTWCPLCFSPVVYNRIVEEQELTFRASGYLLNDNLVLKDHPTGTLWSQLLGQGIRGAHRGTILEIMPASFTTWDVWRNHNPDTLVLSARRLGYQGEIPDPYQGYFSSGASGLAGGEFSDQRLPGKALVYGFQLGGFPTAVPLDELRTQKILTVTQEKFPLVGVYNPTSDLGEFYLARVGNRRLSFEFLEGEKLIQDNQTGTIWNPSTGIAVKGLLKGSRLHPVPAQLAYWFAWSSFYPDSRIVKD